MGCHDVHVVDLVRLVAYVVISDGGNRKRAFSLAV